MSPPGQFGKKNQIFPGGFHLTAALIEETDTKTKHWIQIYRFSDFTTHTFGKICEDDIFNNLTAI